MNTKHLTILIFCIFCPLKSFSAEAEPSALYGYNGYMVAMEDRIFSYEKKMWTQVNTLVPAAPGKITALTAVDGLFAIAVDKQIYLHKGVWTKMAKPAPEKITGLLGSRFGDWYITAGNKVYEYEKSKGVWKPITSEAPGDLIGLSAGSLGLAASTGNKVYRYDTDTKKWTNIKPDAPKLISGFTGSQDNYAVISGAHVYHLEKGGDKWTKETEAIMTKKKP